MKKTILSASLVAAFPLVASAHQNIYVEHNFDSHISEVGGTFSVNEKGTSVYLGGDDAGWYAAGVCQTLDLTDKFSLTGYYEYGRWSDRNHHHFADYDRKLGLPFNRISDELTHDSVAGYENLFEITLAYSADWYGVFTGIGYIDGSQKSATSAIRYGHMAPSSDTSFNSQSDLDFTANKFFLGGHVEYSGFNFAYTWTHENYDFDGNYIEVMNTGSGSSYAIFHIDDDFRTNEHEFIVSYAIDDFTPYVKYTHFVVDRDLTTDEITIGMSYSF
ncbi:hypothetical protein [Vibrio mexicanus]|uniref:hypothetical protein n=1 Tax=Vibrio mexicanus TaxID=1004326 RepID=UPI00063C4C75|nr:hypothetical protein [Vibrio mexicanus]